MAGFFGFFDYTKPGPGVEKDVNRKKGVGLFFELYFRKFWNYAKINTMYAIVSIPAFVVYFIMFTYMVFLFQKEAVADNSVYNLSMILCGALSIIAVIIFGGGPFAAGYNYILRNYYREEHAWIWSDFFGQTMKNIKQSTAIWLIDTLALFLLLFSIKYYYFYSQQQLIYSILLGILIILGVVFVSMHLYIWTMLVTFHLTLKQIYKNALLLTVLGLPRTLGAIVVLVLYFALIFSVLPLSFFLAPFLLLAPAGLIIHMFSYPVIRKYMLDTKTPDNIEYIEEDDITSE